MEIVINVLIHILELIVDNNVQIVQIKCVILMELVLIQIQYVMIKYLMDQNVINLVMKIVKNVIEMENVLLAKIITIGIYLVINNAQIALMVLVILQVFVQIKHQIVKEMIIMGINVINYAFQ